MPENTLEFIITAQNNAKAAFDEAKTQLTGLQTKMKEVSGINWDSSVNASKKLAEGLAIAGGAALAFGTFAVKAAADSEKEIASMDAILKATGAVGQGFTDLHNKIIKQSEAFIQLGFDDEDAAKSMAYLYQRTGDLTKSFKLAALAADLARAKNISLGDASNMIGMVMSGNARALKAYGIEISDTLTPMQALGELQQKVAGQSQAFAGTFSGQMSVLNQEWTNFLETMGQYVLPALTELIKKVNSFIQNELPGWIEKTKEITNWLKDHQYVLYAVAGAIVGALVPAFIAAGAAAVAFAVEMAIALAPFLIGGAIIGGLIAAGVWLYQNWELVQIKATEIWTAITAKLFETWTTITNDLTLAWNSIKTFFDTVWTAISDLFKFQAALAVGLVMAIFKLFGIDIIKVVTDVKDKFIEFWKNTNELFETSSDKAYQTWSSFTKNLNDTLGPASDTAYSTVTKMTDNILAKMTEFYALAKDGWKGMWEDLALTVGPILESVNETFKSFLNKIIEKLRKIIDKVNDVAAAGAAAVGFKDFKVLPPIPYLATGGIVTRPTLAMIGEAGPEAVIPLSRAFEGASPAYSGATINVYVQGGYYLDERAKREFGEYLATSLKRTMKL